MTKIAFATVDWGMINDNPPDFRIGGAGWARMGLPARCLKEFGGIETGLFRRWGFNAKTMQFEMQHEDGRIEAGWDIVVFQRWMYKEAPRFFRAARTSGQICLNDLDDHYWGLATTNQAFYTSHPKANPEENRDHYWKCLGESDLITVSTPFLAEKVKRLGVPVMHLPNMVDMSLFNKRPVEGGNTGLTVGWVGGVPWRSGDLETLKGVLDPFLERHDCVFYHGGAWPNGTQANELAGVPEDRYFSRPIVAIEDYPALMDPIDIGIAPLNDIPFNRAKSAIKTMEYSAAGIPFVAAAMPEYLRYAPEFCAKRPKDWIRMLSKLLDPEERQRQQDINYERIKKQDIHVRYTDWLKIIDFATDVRTKRAAKVVKETKAIEVELAKRTDKSRDQIVREEAEQQQLLPPANAAAILDRALTIGGVRPTKK